MTGLRSVVRAFRANRYRVRAERILARVDQLIVKARAFKDKAARLDAEGSAHRARDGPDQARS